MASKSTKYYGLPLPQDQDIIDAKDISDAHVKIDQALHDGIPMPELRDDGFIYINGVNTNRRWRPEAGVDYYTPAEKQEILDFAAQKAEELKTDTLTEIERIRSSAEENLRTATAEVTAAKEAAEKAETNANKAVKKAQAAQTAAENAEAAATNAQSGANAAKEAAGASAISANEAKTAAETAATSAGNAAAGAITAKEAALDAKAASETSAQNAANAASQAAQSNTNAAKSASAAENSKTAAVQAEKNAKAAQTDVNATKAQIETIANQVSANAQSAGQAKTGAETAKAQAQTIADNLQGTVNAANQATTRANTAAERAEHASQTVQPDATKTRKGIVQIGDGIDVTDGVISVPVPDLSSKADKVHKHSTADINGLDAALAEAGKVKSVNGQTGTVTIAAVPAGGSAGQVLKKTSTGYDWGTDNDTQPDLTPYAKKADVTADLDEKVDKVSGKGLSTEDYTTDEKDKLAGIAEGANNYTLPVASAQTLGGVKVGDGINVSAEGKISVQVADGANPGLSLNNYTAEDKDKLARIEAEANKFDLKPASAQKLGGIKVGTNLSIAADGTLKATDTTYNPATPTSPGLMSAADKTKVDAIGSASEAPDITDKSSVWAAINEAASKGGGGLKITVSTEDAPATGETNSIWFKVV